ncbi:glucose-6-phosphate isomerase [Alistipes sp. OttesenSCG-928-B03]|nr:glucose-6-phosphate isomerase [Alistipes sp. OttesenSCG-928-B03]
MKIVSIDMSKTAPAVTAGELAAMEEKALAANAKLHDGTGQGSEFLGWVGLPSSIDYAELSAIKTTAASLRLRAEVIISIGIGGSYLGARAVIEALGNGFPQLAQSGPTVVFAGQNLSEDYLAELLDAVKDRSIAAIVISKSGTTTEPAVAFRIIKDEIVRRYGRKEAAKRIVAITDANKGALKKMADKEGYKTFAIPDDVGGRYSIFTPAGLLPIACAGIDIADFINGGCRMEEVTMPGVAFGKNPAAQYAAMRNILYDKGFRIELLASYEPRLQYLSEWWKQLFGESEGKEGKGLFPASVTYTADLHSMGQYIQDGVRMIFETVVSLEQPARELVLGAEAKDPDGLNYLAGQRISHINRMAELGVAIAHTEGGVPNMRISLPEISPFYIGALLYFFEKACGISGYLLGVNPFDQPGVEAYKKNMFALLGKPGHEAAAQELKDKM